MWLWFLLHLVVINRSYSQPISEENNARTTRQAECCPCPSKDMDTDASAWKVGTSGISGPSLGVVDDCPCRSRSADSEGASSILVPSTVRTFWPSGMRPTDSNEEPKPLLHPEVDLASSVLQTLREVTDEEYQDAVTRDAARSAARASEGDSINSDSSKNIVTIIVSPKEVDDTIPEASHVHQTRCIHPLGVGNMRLSQRPHVLKEIFSAPKMKSPVLLHRNRNVFDMDSSAKASNVRESYIDRGDELNLKSKPSVYSTFHNKEQPSLQDGIIKNDEDYKENKNKPKIIPNPRLEAMKNKFKVHSDEIKQNRLKLPAMPKLKLNPEKNINFNRDALHQESSNIPAFNSVNAPINNNASSNSLLTRHNLKPFLPLTLKNLHKLKDVELIAPKKFSTSSLFKKTTYIPEFKLVPYLRENSDDTVSEIIDKTISKSSKVMEKISTPKIKDEELGNIVETEEDDLQLVPTNNVIETRILNNLPSASENLQDFAEENLPEESRLNSSYTSDCYLNSQNSNISLQKTEKDTEYDVEALPVEIINDHFNVLSPTKVSSNAHNVLTDDQIDENTCTERKTEIIDTVGEASNNFMQIDSKSELVPSDFSSTITQPNVKSTCILDETTKKEMIDDTLCNESDETKESFTNINVIEKDSVSDESDVIHVDNSLTAKESDADCGSGNSEQNAENFENSRTLSMPNLVSKHVGFDDLKNMSDSLLNLSNAKDNEDTASESLANFDCVLKPNENTKGNDENIKNIKPDAGNSLEASKSAKSGHDSLPQKNDPIEMEGAASNRSPNTYYASGMPTSFLNNILSSSIPLRQPSLLDDLVLFPRSRSESIIGLDNVLNSRLPSLNDIKNTLSNILGPRSSFDDEDVSLAEPQDNCSNEEPSMLTDSSTTRFKSLLPSSKPLKEIDLNIFHLQPLTMTSKGPKSLKIPTLNLNTYKAKLAVPKSLDFRPLKLESSLGKNGGILGATLTLDADKIKEAHTKKISHHLKDFKTGMLQSTLNNLPSLDDVKDKTRSHLVSIPKISNSYNILKDGFHVGEPLSIITENLKTHSALRNIQQPLDPSFHEAITKDTLDSSLVNPHEFLQKLSEAHDDVNDKLYALHVDFSDRLSSIRDNILEKSRMPFLNQPLSSNYQMFRNAKPRTAKGRFLKNKPVTKTSRIKSSNTDKKYNKVNSPLRTEKPSSYSDSRKAMRMSTASSAPIRKIVSSNYKLSDPLQKGNNKFGSLDQKILKAQRVTKPTKLQEGASTTSRPKFNIVPKSISSLPKPDIEKISSLKNLQTPAKLRNSLERRQKLSSSRLKRPFDSNGSPSELLPLKVLPNVPEKIQSSLAESSLKSASHVSNLKPFPKLRSSGPKDNEDLRNLFAWPEITENSFLNKVRDAVRARVASLDPSKTEMNREEDVSVSADGAGSSDMVRSASEHEEVTKCGKCDEIVNDKVSFKCKMVCVKEN